MQQRILKKIKWMTLFLFTCVMGLTGLLLVAEIFFFNPNIASTAVSIAISFLLTFRLVFLYFSPITVGAHASYKYYYERGSSCLQIIRNIFFQVPSPSAVSTSISSTLLLSPMRMKRLGGGDSTSPPWTAAFPSRRSSRRRTTCSAGCSWSSTPLRRCQPPAPCTSR